MSKSTNRIDIPKGNGEKLIDLGNSIKEQHKIKAASSPLTVLDMAKFNEILELASAKKLKAKKLHDEAEALNQEANSELGLLKTRTPKLRVRCIH